MKKLFTYLLIAITLIIAGCSESFDDSEIWNKLDDHENRIADLEELCKQMNTNISSLQSIINALQNNDYVTGVTPITKDGITIGYTITFSKSQPITIYHGKDGVDGATPIIGVRQNSDGIYYWTLNGEWLLNENGNKIKAQGTDGEDAPIPQLKIENDYWYVSYDNGVTWQQLGKATGEDGKDGTNYFQSVTQDDKYVYFTLADGSEIKISKSSLLDITFAQGDLVVISPSSTFKLDYTVQSTSDKVSIELSSSSSIKAKVEADDASNKCGKIVINTTKSAVDEYSKVIVFVSDGEQIIMKSISFEATGIEISDNATHEISAEGGEIQLNFMSNMECEVVIPDDVADWITPTTTRAMEQKSISLTIAPNQELERRATITVRTLDGKMSVNYEIIQLADTNTYCIYYTNGSTEEPIQFSGNLTSDDANIVSHLYDFQKGCWVITFDKSITSIGEYAFQNCSSLTSITIPDSVISIGMGAFTSCTSLTSITIPESVKKIETHAFQGCTNLMAFYGNYASEDNRCLIIDGVLTAFAQGGLTEYTIPNNVTSIGEYAFRGCSSLTSITIPDSVTVIKNNAFYYCTSLTKVIIPDSVTSIGKYAFCHCYSLQSVTIPDSVVEIEGLAFGACSNLESFYGKFASSDNRCLIIDGVLNSFAPAGLTSYIIPDSVTTIGENAFSDCSSLTSITIPDSVTSIGGYAFYDCSSLTNVYCKPTTPPSYEYLVFVRVSSDFTLYVPQESVNDYKSSWFVYDDYIVGYNF